MAGRTLEIGDVRITWLGMSGFRIEGDGKLIYIDPYNITVDDEKRADIILITHGHFDHCSIEDIKKIVSAETVIYATPDCTSKFAGRIDQMQLQLVKPGQEFHNENIIIETVPAYNTNKPFHSRANEYVGYIITIGGKRIYHAGDTDAIPEMEDIKVDVALVPVSGKFVMTPVEASAVVNKFRPKIAIPMHITVDEIDKAKKFKALVNKSTVEVLC